MKDNTYDIIIIGSGAIGSLSAYKLLKSDKKLRILIISQDSKSGSKAAGAMHAVFGEIEKNYPDSLLEQRFLQLGISSRKQFIKFFKENGGVNNFINSKNTAVYLNNSKNFFEKENYNMMKKVIKKFNYDKKDKELFHNLSNNNVNEHIIIDGEFAFNPIKFLTSVNNIIKKNISSVNSICKRVFFNNKDLLTVITSNNQKYFASKIIYAGGSYGVDDIFSKYIKNHLYFGVGTAILLKGPSHYLDKSKMCIRTVNRGGSQCGLHVVPYGDGRYYVGAGNYLTDNFLDGHRATTLNYLLNLAKSDIFGEQFMHYAQCKLLLGMRSKSLDGHPMLGPFNDNKRIILASGFNRVGLTLSFEIADIITDYIFENKVDSFYQNWLPDRDPISYESLESAANFYASSRTANLLEHKIIQPKSSIINKKYKELFDLSLKLNKSIVKKHKLDKDFVLHPDTYNLFLK